MNRGFAVYVASLGLNGKEFSGWVFLRKKETPIALIELKKYDDGKVPQRIIADRDKMAQLAKHIGLGCYLGILITDTERQGLIEDRLLGLNAGLGQTVQRGPLETPTDKTTGMQKNWRWSFAALKITTTPT